MEQSLLHETRTILENDLFSKESQVKTSLLKENAESRADIRTNQNLINCNF